MPGERTWRNMGRPCTMRASSEWCRGICMMKLYLKEHSVVYAVVQEESGEAILNFNRVCIEHVK